MNLSHYSLTVLIFLLLLFKKRKNKHRAVKYYKALVLVKVSNPTKAQIKRYYMWKKMMRNDYKYELLTDRNLTLPNIIVNIITPQALFKKWPNILNIGGRCFKKGVSKTMWLIIVEHYILYAIYSKIQFKYLWMVEQDLGYSGNIYDFMKQYDNNDDDVISTVIWKKPNSFWAGCFSPEYQKWKKKYYNYKYQSYNWITRLSKIAVNKLYNEFEFGRHVFNEEAVPERIMPLNLTNLVINSSFYGYKLSYNTRVSSNEWQRILKDPKNRNKLFHALKF